MCIILYHFIFNAWLQVPPREKGDISPKDYCQLVYELPTLQLLGSPHYILLDVPFTVDSDVQLVCKYLRAYERGKRDIDTLYNEGGQLVQFSTDADLFINECHKLLQKFMPKHVMSSKITQQLFIR